MFQLSTGRNPDESFISDKTDLLYKISLETASKEKNVVYWVLPVCITERASYLPCNKQSSKHGLSMDSSVPVVSLTWDACFGPVLLSHLSTLTLFMGSIPGHLSDLLTLYSPTFTQLIPWLLNPGLLFWLRVNLWQPRWKTRRQARVSWEKRGGVIAGEPGEIRGGGAQYVRICIRKIFLVWTSAFVTIFSVP